MVTELFIKSPVPGKDGVGGGEQRKEIEVERRWRERKRERGRHRVVMSPGSSINRQMR